MRSNPKDHAEITAALEALFAPWNSSDAPGLAVGVMKQGEAIFRRGFGVESLESPRAISPRTRFRIGSTSKHFTALLALQLEGEKRLDLDAPIRTYLPELEGPQGDPSLRLLFQHRGGGRCHVDLGFIIQGGSRVPSGSALSLLARQTGRNFAPDTAMIYNNGGYHLASRAIERVMNAPFEEVLKRRILDPAGLLDTQCAPDDIALHPGKAGLHVALPDGGWRRGVFPSEEVLGEGGIISTLDDMMRWSTMLATRAPLGRADLWTALTALPASRPGDPARYGLGLRWDEWRGLRLMHHAGGVVGGSSQMLVCLDHDVHVHVLSNGARGANPIELAERVLEIVLAPHVQPPPAAPTIEEFADFLGTWRCDEADMVYGFIAHDGVVKLDVAGQGAPLALHREDADTCVAKLTGLGDITARRSPEGLEVTFAGRTTRHRKLPEAAPATFDLDVCGVFACEVPGVSATISRSGELWRVAMSGPWGGHTLDMSPLDLRLARARGADPALPLAMILAFSGSGPRAQGFSLNSVRTRGLMFTRKA